MKAQAYLAETITLDRDWSIARADAHAAYLDAGHDAETADQFAFGFAARSTKPVHPNAKALLIARIVGDVAALEALFVESV